MDIDIQGEMYKKRNRSMRQKNETALFVGSVRCVYETTINMLDSGINRNGKKSLGK